MGCSRRGLVHAHSNDLTPHYVLTLQPTHHPYHHHDVTTAHTTATMGVPFEALLPYAIMTGVCDSLLPRTPTTATATNPAN